MLNCVPLALPVHQGKHWPVSPINSDLINASAARRQADYRPESRKSSVRAPPAVRVHQEDAVVADGDQRHPSSACDRRCTSIVTWEDFYTDRKAPCVLTSSLLVQPGGRVHVHDVGKKPRCVSEWPNGCCRRQRITKASGRTEKFRATRFTSPVRLRSAGDRRVHFETRRATQIHFRPANSGVLQNTRHRCQCRCRSS